MPNSITAALAAITALCVLGIAAASAAPAGAATNLNVAQEGCSGGFARARLTWSPSRLGAQRVDLSATNNGFVSNYSSGSVNSSANVTQLTKLRPGTVYYVRVVTMTASGPLASDTLQFTATCAVGGITAPIHLNSAAISSNTVRLAWLPGQNNAFFCVDTALSLNDLLAFGPTWRNHHCWTTASTVTIDGLRCGTTYYWLVYAWNGGQNIKSSPSSLQTGPCIIGRPARLDSRQVGSSSVRLSWQAGTNNRWFCVDVARSESDLNNFGPTWRNYGCWQTGTSLRLDNVACGVTYHWNVYAWNHETNTRSANSTFRLTECSARVQAEIESLGIVKAGSVPERYSVKVVATLPNSCYTPNSYQLRRDNRTFDVTVLNLLEIGPRCTGGEKTYELEIFLANNLQSGVRYTVNVNGETLRFTAD